MLVLVVDSSTPAVTAALVEVTASGVTIRAHRCTVDARAHGELLAPQVDAVLADVAVLAASDARRRVDLLGGLRRCRPAPGRAGGRRARGSRRAPDATALATLAAERIRTGAPGDPLTPLYLRRPDAVAATARKPVLP